MGGAGVFIVQLRSKEYYLKSMIEKYFPATKENLMAGTVLFCRKGWI